MIQYAILSPETAAQFQTPAVPAADPLSPHVAPLLIGSRQYQADPSNAPLPLPGSSAAYIRSMTTQPTWFFALGQDAIAARPVISGGDANRLLPPPRNGTPNLGTRTFNCRQPEWCPRCL